MTSPTIPILLVTANVGSIFEDPTQMLKIWTEEFLTTIMKLCPKFVALHCQEVGGKNYENSMKHVEEFVSLLMSSNELRLFDKVRVFLDEDYSSAENFTALGNFYFIHESIKDVLIYDFKDLTFVPANGKEIHSGNIEAVVTKEKAKFPQDLFPEGYADKNTNLPDGSRQPKIEFSLPFSMIDDFWVASCRQCKWSRKGFLRTRWSINGTVFDLINIHLFHDASNFIAMEAYPSVYCKNRRRALEHTLQRFHTDAYGKMPYFLFGDFNFRTDTDGVIKKLTEGLNTIRIQNNKNNDYTKLQYTNDASEPILTVGKKEFNHSNHQKIFLNPTETWLKEFDKELEAFENTLTEFPVTFPPSYPFEEKISQASTYMQTRCPAWCDRVLLSLTAKKLVSDVENVEYNLMGKTTCMGDHKPVYLKAALIGNAGILKCCDHSQCLPLSCQCCRSFASVIINVVDMSDYLFNTRKSYADVTVDSKLLHEPITKDMLSHDPYTPESADSRSPCPEKDGQGDAKHLRSNSVTPQELKAKLERILNESNAQLLKRSTSQNVCASTTPRNKYRTRAMSEIPSKLIRPRLVSNSSVNSSARLQSHHSSSDEDWFEYEEKPSDCSSRKSSVFVKTDDTKFAENKSLEFIRDNYTKVHQIRGKKRSMQRRHSSCCCFIL